LADEGLAAALAAKARTVPAEVSVSAPDIRRLPKPVEIAIYFCCSEALQNATKYARASSIVVALRLQGSGVAFSVADDGDGFELSTVRRGVGMRSMAERVESLGGTLEVRSAPGVGTTISALVPLGDPRTIREAPHTPDNRARLHHPPSEITENRVRRSDVRRPAN
jgi:signal transduction histidine kinase